MTESKKESKEEKKQEKKLEFELYKLINEDLYKILYPKKKSAQVLSPISSE
jgi:hypothetical protein